MILAVWPALVFPLLVAAWLVAHARIVRDPREPREIGPFGYVSRYDDDL